VGHLAGWLARPGPSFGRRFLELAAAGTATAAVAAPWLLNNLLEFGHLMPISGQAESLRVELADHLHLVPVKLMEYLLVILPLPSEIEATAAMRAVATLAVLAAAGATLVVGRRWEGDRRVLLVVGGLYTLGLATFYGLTFGAGHFMSRYLFPASPFLTLLTVGALWAAAERLGADVRRRAAVVVPALLVLLALGLNLRLYVQGTEHGHFQVVDWVEAHVPDEVWVGAIQTGTLGFFHDRTINLDGKVNPEALAARTEKRIPRYVVERDIQYLADWHGISEWTELPALEDTFDLVVDDPERNLAVLRRHGAPFKRAPEQASRVGR
jgi:hypothetical protein